MSLTAGWRTGHAINNNQPQHVWGTGGGSGRCFPIACPLWLDSPRTGWAENSGGTPLIIALSLGDPGVAGQIMTINGEVGS